jgi:hypothetical protein
MAKRVARIFALVVIILSFAAISGSAVVTPPGATTVEIPQVRPRSALFWKSYASCARPGDRSRRPILDRTLAKAGTDGLVLAAVSGADPRFDEPFYLVLRGSPATPDAAPDCEAAVSVLGRLPVDGGRRSSIDPASNLAAELLAALLNFRMGASRPAGAVAAVDRAVLMLGKVEFDGSTHLPMSTADGQTMNALAQTLANYNSGK